MSVNTPSIMTYFLLGCLILTTWVYISVRKRVQSRIIIAGRRIFINIMNKIWFRVKKKMCLGSHIQLLANTLNQRPSELTRLNDLRALLGRKFFFIISRIFTCDTRGQQNFITQHVMSSVIKFMYLYHRLICWPTAIFWGNNENNLAQEIDINIALKKK